MTASHRIEDANSIWCRMCQRSLHRRCLGLPRLAFAGGIFRCPVCCLESADLPRTANSLQLAYDLMRAEASRVATSTDATYAGALNRFCRFALENFGLQRHQALPYEEGQIVPAYLIKLFIVGAGKQYALSTIQGTLSALANWHRSRGVCLNSTSEAEIKTVFRSEEIRRGVKPAASPQAKVGITPELLHLLISFLHHRAATESRYRLLHLRDSSAFSVGFFGMLRRSEIVALRMGDLTFGSLDGEAFAVIRVRNSKTDQAGRGVDIYLANTSRDGLAIVTPLRYWHNTLHQMGFTDLHPLFPAWENIPPGLSFSPLRNGQTLGERLQVYLTQLRAAFPFLPLDVSMYGMHSLRRGGATAAWENGIDRRLLMGHGRWESDAIDVYLTASILQRLRVSKNM